MTNPSTLTVFAFGFSAIRTLYKDAEPWFVAADICAALEIANPTQALSRLDADEKNTLILNEGIQGRGNPNVNVVNESGLYTLVMGSRKAEAKKFRKWVTSEVLPAIRQKGSYAAPTSDEAMLWKNVDLLIERGVPAGEAFSRVTGRISGSGRTNKYPAAPTPGRPLLTLIDAVGLNASNEIWTGKASDLQALLEADSCPLAKEAIALFKQHRIERMLARLKTEFPGRVLSSRTKFQRFWVILPPK